MRRGKVDFGKMPYIYWDNITKMNYLERLIIVYSIMYYEFNESCVSDEFYDNVSHQLLELINECTSEEFIKTDYYYVMKDFDGNTGFDLPDKLSERDKSYLINVSNNVYESWRKSALRKK